MNPEAAPSLGTERSRHDLIGAAIGAMLVVLSALPVDENRLSGAERVVFRFFNALPALLYQPVWIVMQLGNVLVVPVAAAAALLARRPRLAASLFTAGSLAYVGAKVVKRFVTRGRPSALVADVNIHGAAAHGLGFVSGHAAVVVALAVVAFPYLGRSGRWLIVGLAALVCVARVYVGAHLPLDVVGGAALGVVVACAARLVIGRPSPCS